MTLTEKTAAIAATLGLSYSVTDDAAYLLRDGTVVGVVDDHPAAKDADVCCYEVKRGMIWCYDLAGSRHKAVSLGYIEAPTPTRQRVDAADIKSRYTVLDVWRMLMPQSAPIKDGVYHSPFRDDRNPSFSISQQGRKWKDFSSDEGGDIYDFYQKATGCTWIEAVNALAAGATNQPVLAPEPPKEKILAVTDTQREFERQSVDGFKAALADTNSVLSRLLKAKGISEGVTKSLWKEGSLGAIDGKPVYLNHFGVKIRNEVETSRSSRWMCGGSSGYVWRHRMLLSPHIKHVTITESETDAMRLMTLVPQGLHRLIVAAPSAGWKPTCDMLFLVGGHRKVLIFGDNDSAGIAMAERLEQGFRDVSNCDVKRVIYRDEDGKDACDLSAERIAEIFAEFA